MSGRDVENADFLYGRWLSSPSPGEEVVISGVSGRFPESRNVREFCDNIYAKKELITDDDRRWKLPHPEIPQRTGKVYDIDKYDAGFFGVHGCQADVMDPTIRMVMETAVEAIMDAGINPVELEGSKTGVFVGTFMVKNDGITHTDDTRKHFMTGHLPSYLSRRISYYLKLKGPVGVLDTACSSALFAFDHAFKAIRNGQCDNAIVGGTNLLLNPRDSLQFFRLGVLSSNGRCKTFDEDADGYVRGETISCVFLQKAKNSRRMYAQIINTRLNSDGYKEQGIAFPSPESQQQLLTEIYEESAIHPDDLSYLETHGTATRVGDVQEVESVDLALARKRKKALLVGSVKPNVGHTEPSAGLVSITKVILAMETGWIAPNINLKRIKKGMIGFEEGRMKVVTEMTELEGDEAIVGINSFGVGGSNCHVILRRFKKKKLDEGSPKDDVPRLICVSGRTEESVLRVLNELNNRKLDAETVALLHQLYKINIKNHLYRGFTIISKRGPMKSSFNFITNRQPLYMFFGPFEKNYKVLASYLMNFPIFKKIISKIDELLIDQRFGTFVKILEKQQENTLGSILTQIGLVDLLKHLEIAPSVVWGDSWGKLISGYYYDDKSLKETVSTAIKILHSDLKSKTQFRILETLKNNNLWKDSFSYDDIVKAPKSITILNISDSHLNSHDILITEENKVNFLQILGRLYEQGHNPQLHKLYPEVEFPVSRGTAMISPLIEWNHSKSWYTYKFTTFGGTDYQQKAFKISCDDDEYKFIEGHMIDGRNLFPATQYLYLVWQTMALARCHLLTDTSVVFEDCKFIKAVTVPKNGSVILLVMIQRGGSAFEVTENGSPVVTGRVYTYKDANPKQLGLESPVFVETDPARTIQMDEIYRDLYLRGYNYSGLFKGIRRCNVDATSALIKWEDNWCSFMDKMLQLKILHKDTKLLYVPVGIKRLVIDPIEHHDIVTKCARDEVLLPARFDENCNTIKSGGIEIHGLDARSISKRKTQLEPVLEKYEYVPNHASLELSQSMRVNVQIVLENTLENQFKAVEIIDDFTDPHAEFLLPLISRALDDVPVVAPNLIISTENLVEETPGIKIDNFVLSPESNLILLVATKILQRTNVPTICEALLPNGYILTREEINYVPNNLQNMDIVTVYITDKEKLILLKRNKIIPKTKHIEISSTKFDWLPELQNSLKYETNVIVYSRNEEPEGILGLINCIRREPSGNKVKCFFIMDEAPEFDPQNSFYKNQIDKDLAINICKNGTWGTYRHLLLEELPAVDCESSYASVTNVGDLSSLRWIEGSLKKNMSLNEDQVLVETHYSAMNFKDIMAATGRVTADAFTLNRIEQECILGFEFAGIDSRGRRVCGMVSNRGFATHIAADVNFLWPVSDSWSLEEAATIPCVYVTVLYALEKVKRKTPGTSILIHSATGGIGLAALSVCQYYQFDIYVTVGTQEKRDYLRKHYPQIPESHIGNSRDTSFEEMIKTQTKGRGVDILLNSLSEDKLKASVRCMARGGHFLEIGKFDLANNTALNLLIMEKEISYHGVMLDSVIAGNYEIKRHVLKTVQNGIDAGFVKPLPRSVFDKYEIEAAHRYMMTGKHMGKVLLKIRNEENVSKEMIVKAVPRFHCDGQKSYVVLGGLGGIGLELADWLMLRGAKKLILVSRFGVQTGYQAHRLEVFKSYGLEVKISTKDVTTLQGCTDLINEANDLGVVDGIFNLAVLLKDALLEDQTEESFLISLAPKAKATMYLDQVTRALCPQLRYFVIFSSVSCGRGNAGQTNYGMANSIMERICEKRKREGLPAVAIQWGAVGEVGLVAKMQKENKELVIGGTLQQKISSCLEVLDKLLKQNNPVVSSMVVAEKHTRNTDLVSAVETVGNILGIKDLKTISQHSTLAELGMDSMMGTEIIQILEKDFEIYVTAKDIRSLTFSKLSDMEADQKFNSTGVTNINKSQEGANLLLQSLPDSKTSHASLVTLSSQVKNDEEASTVFVLPGIEGVFKPLELLTKNLKALVLGVQYNYNHPEDSIEQAAQNILSIIEKKLIKEKPFVIIGYSFGAVVGLELAHLLEKKNYSGEIILIDGSPSYSSSSAREYLSGETEAELQSTLMYKISAMVLPVDVLATLKDKLLKCEDLNTRMDLVLSLLPLDDTKKQKLEKQAAVTLYKRFKAIINYQFEHEKVKSFVNLFKSRYPMVTEEEDYQLGKLCEKQVCVTTVDGDHVTMVTRPELIQKINEILMTK